MNRSQYDPLEDEDTLRIMQNLAQLKGQSNRRQVLTGQMPIPEPKMNAFNMPVPQAAQGSQGASPADIEAGPTPYEDIRANQINTPEVQQKGVLSRFGKALGDLVNIMGSGFGGEGAEKTPPQYMHAGMQKPSQPPAVNQAPAQGAPQYLGAKPGDLERGLAATPDSQRLINHPAPPPSPPSQAVQFPAQENSLYGDPFAATSNPLTPRTLNPQFNPQMAASPEEVKQIVSEKANEPPGSYAVPGSVSLAVSDPQTKASLESLIGEQLPPEALQLLQKYETVADAFSNGIDVSIQNLDPEIKAIQQRLASRNLSRQDMIMMGAVLLAPAIISGIMGGREAAISSLAGGSQALAQGLQKKEEGLKEDEQRLSQLGVQKAGLLKSKLDPLAQLGELRKNLRPPQVKPGKQTLPEKFNEMMQMENLEKGEDGKVYDNISGLKVDVNHIRNPDDLSRYKDKVVPEALEGIEFAERAGERLDEYISILEQIGQGEERGVKGNALTKGKQAIGYRQKVVLPDGREVDAQTEVARIRALLQDDYRVAKDMRQLTANVINHFDDVIQSPYEMSSFSGDMFKNAKDQAIGLRDALDKNVVTHLKRHKIDTSDFEKIIQERPSFKKQEREKQAREITDYYLNNPKAQQQASQTGKFIIGE